MAAKPSVPDLLLSVPALQQGWLFHRIRLYEMQTLCQKKNIIKSKGNMPIGDYLLSE